MTYAAIAYTAPQYEDYYLQYIKAYSAGTTTPIPMATDSSGLTTVAKAQLNSKGFITSDGEALFIPYIEGSYDLYIFPTALDADNNDTSSAIRIADDMNSQNVSIINDLSQAYEFDTVADMKASTIVFPIRKVLKTKGYYEAGDGGQADYLISDTAVADGYGNIELANGNVAELQITGVIVPKQFGAVGDGVTDDSDPFVVIFAQNLPIIATDTYLVSQRFTTETLIISGGGTFALSGTTYGFMDITGSDSVIDGVHFVGAGEVDEVSLSVDVCFVFSNYDAQNNVVRNCTFKDFTFYCIDLKSKNSSIDNNRFDNIGYWAIGSFNRFNYITNNTFVSCGNSFASYTGGVITVSYSSLDGDTMATTKAERNYILNNIISTSRQVAIDTHSGRKLTITGNIITDCDLDGIYLHRTNPATEGLTDADGRITDCIINGNTVINCLSGITLSSFQDDSVDRTACLDNLIENNLIRDCVSSGINLARGSKKNTVRGNDIDGSGRPIYLFYWTSSNMIQNNYVRASASSAYLLDINAGGLGYSCDFNVVENNTFDLQGFDITAVRNQLGCDSTQIKNNEFLNRGLLYPITDAESGTARQSLIVHLPRAWSYALNTPSDMRGEQIRNVLPSAGDYVGWTCVTAGDQSATPGVWKGYGTIES